MTMPRSRTIDGMKFMWDGVAYESAEEAIEATQGYEKDNFETRVVEEDEEIHIYTRRVVADVVVEGDAPV